VTTVDYFEFFYRFVKMENIYSTFSCFYIFAKVLGAFPMSFDGPIANGKIKTRKFDILISCFITLLIIFLVYAETDVQMSAVFGGTILTKAWDIFLIFGLLTLLIKLFYQIFKHKNIKRILKLLNDFDVKVNILNQSEKKQVEKLSRSDEQSAFLTGGISK
jgi:hypothetical protein